MIERLTWFINRLYAMSPAELAYRIRNKSHQIIEKRKCLKEKKLISDNLLSLDDLKTGNFYFDPDKSIRQLYIKEYPDLVQETVKNADKICNKEFTILGNGAIRFNEKINWFAGIVTDKSWPKIYRADIDFKGRDDIGDIRLNWELNRHHHFVILAKAYFITNDKKYLDEFISQFNHWIDENPVSLGSNWSSAMELAIRVQNWVWSFFFFNDGSKDTKKIRQLLLTSINQHCNYYKNELALHSSANNHLIVESVSLCITGILFPSLKDSNEWVSLGIKHLKREIPLQILSDGINAEQAVHYQAFVMEALILLLTISRKNQYRIPAEIELSLINMCRYIRQLIDTKGNVPSFGDSDDGHIINLVGKSFNDYVSLLNQASILFQSGIYKLYEMELDEQSFWILGEESLNIYNNLPRNAEKIKSTTFEKGGITVLRHNNSDKEYIMTFDHAPLGYGSLAAHGHADALSITLNINGQDVLIDPGTYIYNIRREWRDYFRRTSIHNTLTINDRDQSVIKGPFLWGKKANSKLLRCNFNEKFDFVSAEHDGYSPIIHKRSILYLKPDIWLIEDEIKGEYKSFLLNYSFNDNLEIKQEDNSFYILHEKQYLTFLKIYSCEEGQRDINDIFISKKFGLKKNSKSIRYRYQGNRINKIYSLITCRKDVDLSIRNDEITIIDDGSSYTFNFNDLERGSFYVQKN